MSAAATGIPWGAMRDRTRAAGLAAEALRLAAFLALAAFVAGHWVSGLVESPPVNGTAAVVVIATALGATLVALGRTRLPRPVVHLAALAAVATFGAAALVAMGLPARQLLPGAWSELAADLDRGLAGIRTVEWPYAGDDEWVRRAILLGAPVLVVLSAALAFWPVRRGRGPLLALALVALLAAYGVPVTENDPGAPLVRGLILFLLVAAWLWLPRVSVRDAAPAAIVVVAIGVLSLPLAGRLDAETAAIDYQSWNWFGGKDITFDWNHSYGPMTWSREGTTLLNVEADRPLYWKAEVLDSFDGLRWLRSGVNDRTSPGAELPERREGRWDERIRVTVRSLETDFVVGAGTPYFVQGAGEAVSGSADGTVRRLDEPLRRGDSYTVRAYVPDPSPRQLRADAGPYSSSLVQYTQVELPSPGEDALNSGPGAGAGSVEGPVVSVPLVSDPDRPRQADRTLSDSPYSQTYRLARRLTAGAPSTYEAVRRVQNHLRRGYRYNESPPSQEYPLEAFLFEDKIGYCQQFSGAMALMLRMSGIPARVVSGFSPGSFNRDSGEYRVRDLDAHSWVEVAFPELGWVTFDPTPPAAPAERAGQGLDALGSEAPAPGGANSGGDAAPGSDAASDGAGGSGSASGSGGVPWVAIAILAALVAAALLVMAGRRRRDGGAGAGAEADLRELQRALPRLGWALPAGTTLLELERRLARAAGPASAGYVARLRAGRFAAGAADPPAAAERRALRRELTTAGGLRARLRGFVALPPVLIRR